MLRLRGAALAGLQASGPGPQPNAAGPAAPGRAAARPRQPQVRVRMVQINLRALLQLAVMAIILYQVLSPPSPLLCVHFPPACLCAWGLDIQEHLLQQKVLTVAMTLSYRKQG